MILFEHPYYHVKLQQEGILSFHWEDEHKNMNYEDFKEACSNYAGYVGEHQSSRLLIDTRNFAISLPDTYSSWQKSIHQPRLYRLGVRKIAYMMKPEHIPSAAKAAAGEDGILTRYLSEARQAIAWLSDDK